MDICQKENHAQDGSLQEGILADAEKELFGTRSAFAMEKLQDNYSHHIVNRNTDSYDHGCRRRAFFPKEIDGQRQTIEQNIAAENTLYNYAGTLTNCDKVRNDQAENQNQTEKTDDDGAEKARTGKGINFCIVNVVKGQAGKKELENNLIEFVCKGFIENTLAAGTIAKAEIK